MNRALHIGEAGALTLIEDLGRPGHADIGLSPSGALDRGALRLANRLVGNAEDAACLEILVGGFSARFTRATWFAVSGAWGPVTLDGHEVAADTATRAQEGGMLRVGTATNGIRYYLAVRGGFEAPALLGSRSSDTLSALGPAAVATGDELQIGHAPDAEVPVVDFVPDDAPSTGAVTVRLHPGPRADWFTEAAIASLYEHGWQVAPESDRVGVRLDGEPLTRRPDAVGRELPSEAMIAGAIQVPPSGKQTVLLADHPVTGGYPVVAVVDAASLDAFAQVRPGQSVVFRHSL